MDEIISRLTILYQSRAITSESPPTVASSCSLIGAHTLTSLSPTKDSGESTYFIDVHSKPIAVRADTWWTFETCFGRFEFWRGPVLKQVWLPGRQRPKYTIHTPWRNGGFGIRILLYWMGFSKGFSAVYMPTLPERAGSTSLKWDFHWHNIVPKHSDIFEYIVTGNLNAVKLLFSQQKASPLDVTPDGQGLLHVWLMPRILPSTVHN